MKPILENSIYQTVAGFSKSLFSTFSQRNKQAEPFKGFNPQEMDSFSQNSPTVVFVFNHQTMGYEYFSPNIKEVMGHERNLFEKGGLKFAMSLVHSDHTKIYNRYVLPIMFKYYLLYAIKRRVLDLRFSYTFQIKKSNGEYIWALHYMNAIHSNKMGFPTHTSVYLSDITEFKFDDNINISVSAKGTDGIFKQVYSRIYAKHNTFTFSDRELEVLELIAKGQTSKEISETLNLSIHTVIRHRKNMMGKAQVKNSSELIQLAFSKKIEIKEETIT